MSTPKPLAWWVIMLEPVAGTRAPNGVFERKQLQVSALNEKAKAVATIEDANEKAAAAARADVRYSKVQGRLKLTPSTSIGGAIVRKYRLCVLI